jgi:hypothetical protein
MSADLMKFIPKFRSFSGELRSGAGGRTTAIVLSCLVLLGLLAHGGQASHLGLYLDDVEFLVLGMYKANGDWTRFVFTDMTGYLTRERPLQYFPWTMARAAFVAGLPTLHWLLVGFLVLDASLLALLAHRMIGEAWFTFAVGVLFMVYPLSPLQAIWATDIHYLAAAFWALLSALCCLNAIETERQLKWTVLAALFYLASFLSHESAGLIPVAFVAAYLLPGNQRFQAISKLTVPVSPRRTLGLLATLGVVLLVSGLWRALILPAYGLLDYESSTIVLDVRVIFNKVLHATATIVFPWADVLRQVLDWRPGHRYFLLAGLLSLLSGVITFLLAKRSAVFQAAAHGEEQPFQTRRWLWTVCVSGSIILAALVIIGISPLIPGSVLGRNSFSRLYFAPTIGVALACPALCLLAVRLYECAPRLVSTSALVCLLAFGFIFFPFSGNIFTHRSESLQVFNRYSQFYAVGLVTYILGAVSLAILSIMSTRSRRRCSACFVAGAIAALVLVGSLYQFSVKQQYAVEWCRQVAMFEQLHRIAPSLKNDTFVIIDDPQDYLAFSHYELSGYLVVLYDNWTVMGNRKQYVRFFSDGVESSFYNFPVSWDPPDVVGPQTATPIRGKDLPLSRISYDRILSLDFDGNHLNVVPSKEVVLPGGNRLTLENHPDRISGSLPVKTAVWRHLAGRCVEREGPGDRFR